MKHTTNSSKNLAKKKKKSPKIDHYFPANNLIETNKKKCSKNSCIIKDEKVKLHACAQCQKPIHHVCSLEDENNPNLYYCSKECKNIELFSSSEEESNIDENISEDEIYNDDVNNTSKYDKETKENESNSDENKVTEKSYTNIRGENHKLASWVWKYFSIKETGGGKKSAVCLICTKKKKRNTG